MASIGYPKDDTTGVAETWVDSNVVFLNPQEQSALVGLSHFCQSLYKQPNFGRDRPSPVLISPNFTSTTVTFVAVKAPRYIT